MSGSPSPMARGPKAMSSRLITMKFMQRSAAQSPTASSASKVEHRTSKRRKVDDTPLAAANNSSLEALQVKAALDDEERKRGKAIERLAKEVGETKWELSTTRKDFVPTSDGFTYKTINAQVPGDDASTGVAAISGRRTYGKVKNNAETPKPTRTSGPEPSASNSSASSSESDSDTHGMSIKNLKGASNYPLKASSFQRRRT